MKAQPIKVFNASWWIIACLRLFKLSQSCCCRLRHNCCCCCRLCNTCNTNKSAKDDWKDFEWESYSLSSFLPTLNCSLRVVVPVKREGKWQSQLCEAVAQAVGSLLGWMYWHWESPHHVQVGDRNRSTEVLATNLGISDWWKMALKPLGGSQARQRAAGWKVAGSNICVGKLVLLPVKSQLKITHNVLVIDRFAEITVERKCQKWPCRQIKADWWNTFIDYRLINTAG